MDKKFVILVLAWIIFVVVVITIVWKLFNAEIASVVTLILSIVTVVALDMFKQVQSSGILLAAWVKRFWHFVFLIASFSGVHALVGLFGDKELLKLIQQNDLKQTALFVSVLAGPYFLVAYIGGQMLDDLKYLVAIITISLSFILMTFFNQGNFSQMPNGWGIVIFLGVFFVSIVCVGVFTGNRDYLPKQVSGQNDQTKGKTK